MKRDVTEKLGIEFPIFAFSHCRDVVAAVSAVGGMGVLGASSLTAIELETELDWIDEHCDDRPYAVDLVFPKRELADALAHAAEAIPPAHRNFVEDLLDRYGVNRFPEGSGEDRVTHRGIDWGDYDELLEIIFDRPNIKVLALALGVPPPAVVERAHATGRFVAALCGTPDHAVRNRQAGADFIVCQGTEAGGHTGEIATTVLVPQVVDAVAPTPVIAAGGIASGRQMAAALALGASGVWCGSVWLTTEESDTSPDLQQKLIAATSSDTVRSKSISGKPLRMLRSDWTDEWDAPGAPAALPMPVQGVLVEDAMGRIERAARHRDSPAYRLLTGPAGQIIGQLTAVRRVKQVVQDIITEYVDVVTALAADLAD